MAATLQAAPDTARPSAAALQHVLPELVALSLGAKQAHWNVTGPQFLALHALTDELASDARSWADRVAERAVAFGFPVDARPATVASVAHPFPAGRLSSGETLYELAVAVDNVVKTARGALHDLATGDAVSHDVVVDVLEGLEKYRWMLDAQQS